MSVPAPTDKPATSLSQDLLNAARYYLGNRRAVFALAGIAIAGGLAFNWNWLVAAGVAPILISILPCAAMCAIGVCCLKKTADQPDSARPTEPVSPPGVAETRPDRNE